MLMTIGLLSFVGMIVFIFMSFRSWAKKDGNMKRNLLIAGSCFVAMLIFVSLDDTSVENQVADKGDEKVTVSKQVVTEDTEEEKAKQEAEDKVKAQIAKATAASEAEDKKKEAEEKLKLEEEKKKEELAKQEAAKAKAEEDKKKAEEAKKKEATKVAEKANKEEVLITILQAMVMASEGIILDIRQNPYGSLDWQQMHVIVSDAWYESPEHEKERFAESISEVIESAIYQSEVVKTDQTILTHFLDEYDKELATEKIFGGYKIKR